MCCKQYTTSLFLPILKPRAADVSLTLGGNRSTSQVQKGPPIEKRNNMKVSSCMRTEKQQKSTLTVE